MLVNLYKLFPTCSVSLFLTISVVLASDVFAQSDTANPKPHEILGNHDIPPMIYRTESGYEGIVIDLANAIVRAGGIDANISAMDWGKAQERLKSGQASALLQINTNPERAKIFAFSEPLLLSEFSIFRRSDSVDLQSIQSLYGKKVGVEAKGYPKSILSKYKKIKAVIIESWAQGFEKLSQGEIDAVIVDRWVGEFELSKLDLRNIVVSNNPVESSYSSIAVRKQDTALLEQINRGISAIRQSGEYDRILDSWKSTEVIYLTREQRIQYLVFAFIVVFGLTILYGVFYVRRIKRASRLQRELNTKLEQRNDELLQFAYRTSHDLKAPLTSSKQLLGFINQDLAAGQLDEASKNVAVVKAQMEKLERLVVSVLDLASSEFKEEAIEVIDFPELIKEIKERLLLNDLQNSVNLEISDHTNTKVLSSKARITQVIENIVSNGIKYRDESKGSCFVKVRVANDAHRLNISIEDNGLGIPSDRQGQIYDMFQRFHPEAGEGSGLGLSIVKKHIEMLDGEIKVVSTQGQGTIFDIRLPLKS